MRSFVTVIAALSFALSGCMVGPDYVRPDVPKQTGYTRKGDPEKTTAIGQSQRFDSSADVPAHWWTYFNSEKLDPLVNKALAANQTLQAANATLRESQATLNAGYGVFYPQLDAKFGASRLKSSPISAGVNFPASIYNLFTLSATVSYSLDIWGGDRRRLEGLKAQVDVQRYALLASYLTLTGNLVNSIVARSAYQAEIEATAELIQLQKSLLDLTRAQYRAGTAPYTNVLSIQSQLATFEASLPPLKQKLSQTEHLLATLSGQTPVEWQDPGIVLADLKLPENLPKTLPSQLVRRRPDILQSESQLHAASAQIGVATAALYPSIDLSASYGGNRTSIGNFFGGTGNFWNFGGSITAPIFHGGTLRSQKQAAVEAYQASLATYRQTVLGAFQQVADSLRALENDAEALQTQSEALATADEAMKLIQANYRSGTASYLQVLTVNAQYFQAKINYFQAIAQRYQDTVALFVALGGGWWNV